MKKTSKARWNDDLNTGHGNLTIDSLVLNNIPYSFNSRFVDGTGINPEE